MQVQTVFRAGNSDVVAIPKYLGQDTGIKTGKKVVLSQSDDGIFIKPAAVKAPKKALVSKEFKKWLDNTLKENAEILDELADR